MATNSITGLRRSPRVRKPPPPFPPRRTKKVRKEIPRRSSRLQNLSREISAPNLRRSPRLKVASFSEKSEQFAEKLENIGKISNVEDLLRTGLLNGLPVTCVSSEARQDGLQGKIKDGGFLCGCSGCNYNGEVLLAKMFEKHAGVDTKVQADHVFIDNGLNLHEVSQLVRNIPEEDICVKILNLRGDLKQKQLSEELLRDPAKSITARRSKRKRRESGFQRSIAWVGNKRSKRLIMSLRLEDMNEELNVEEISRVKDLLKTGILEGASITYISDKNHVEFPGIIKGTGYVCGCPKCSYTGEALSAQKFVEHALCKAANPNNCIFLSNRISIFEVTRKLKGIHGSALKNKLNELMREVEFGDGTHVKQYTSDKLEKDKSLESSNHLQKSFEGSMQVLKCYRRYNPERPLMDVQGLLSTGLLEGFRVTYMRNKAKLAASIQGPGYKCGCTSCKNAKVITARELQRHAGEFSNNPTENIYLDNGTTLCQLVKELKGIPLYILGNFLQEKIKCCPNYNSFEIWKGSFKMGDDLLNFGSDSENQPGCKQSLVHCISKDEVSVSEATKNTDRTADASHPVDDYHVENLEPSSDQFLNKPIKPTNSNFHCLIPKPISNLSETLKDGVPEGTSDLAKDSVPEKIFVSKSRGEASISEATKNNDWMANSSHVGDNDSLKNCDSNADQYLSQRNESTSSNSQQCSAFKPTVFTDPAEIIRDSNTSKLRGEVSISKATKNNDWMANSSHVRDDDSLKNLNCNTDRCLSQPNESSSSSSQQCSAFRPTIVTASAEIITDRQSEGTSEASMLMNTFEPYDVEVNTAPGSGGLDTPGSAPSDLTSVVCKGSLNIGQHGSQLRPVPRKIRSPRVIKFIKRNFHAGPTPSSLAEQTVQKLEFTFSGVGCATASDVTEAAAEDPDYNPLESASKEGLTDVENPSLTGVVKRRDGHLHKRLFEEGGLPDGTVLTYRHQNKVLLTGVKQGNAIKCTCHNNVFAPSQFEAHAGMGHRRQPYQNIYNSDGKTLHKLSLELPVIPRSGILNTRAVIHFQHKCRERTARPLVKKVRFVPTSHRLKRVFQSQKGVLVRCTICKEKHATLGNEADPKLVIFCNQCDQAYHIGCLEDQESFKIKDVFHGNWFCCTECTQVHNHLKNICALGVKPVLTPFFDSLKKPHTTEKGPVNLSWQIFRGNAEDRVLLSHTLQLLKSVFRPIILGKQEMMRQMVFGKQVVGTGLDFRGMFFITIKLNEEIVSVAALRVFGNYVAELPLATTSKLWRQQGYFRMLLSLIEDLLHILQVRLLVSPVHDKMQSVWIDKFGFAKASDQKVQMLKEQHGVILFEDTDLLEKEI